MLGVAAPTWPARPAPLATVPRSTPVHQAVYPDAERIRWRPYNGQPRGRDLIRMAPWFNDGSLWVRIARRYYVEDAAAAHREVERGIPAGSSS